MNTRLRVLCADDNAALAFMMKQVLEQAGHVAECVGDGTQALERIVADPTAFDVLVTDHRMPGLTGLGLVSKLRDTPFSGVIIVHTAVLSPAETAVYRALAVDHILIKPVPMAEFMAIVQQIADRRDDGSA